MWGVVKKVVLWSWNRRLRFAFLIWAIYALTYSPISSLQSHEICEKHHLGDRLSIFYLQQLTGFLSERDIPFHVADQQIYMTLKDEARAIELLDMHPNYVRSQMFDPSNPDYPAYPKEWIALYQKWKDLSVASLDFFAANGTSDLNLNDMEDAAFCDLMHAIIVQGKDRQKIWLPSDTDTIETLSQDENKPRRP